jgi:FkbM family methyltransferase
MEIQRHTISVYQKELHFFMPKGDDCGIGTLSALSKNEFHLNEIGFQNGDVFVDIGCNIGLVSLVAAIMFPQIKIFSFDANPVATECLKLSILANNINNIEVFNLAVGAKDEDSAEFLSYSEQETCTIRKELSNPRDVSYKVKVISLENLMRNIVGKNVKHLKCDIESGEFDLFDHVFSNCPEILDQIDSLHLEVHPFDDSNPRSKKLKEMVRNKFKEKIFF